MKTFGRRLGTTAKVLCNLASYAVFRQMIPGNRPYLESPLHWYKFPFSLRNQVLWSPALEKWFCPTDESAIECMLNLPQYEPVDWVSPKLGQVMIDVGAYTGWYAIQAARAVGEGGQVVALEPDETNRRQLVHNLRLNHIGNVTVSGLAAWSKSGVIGWYAGTQPVWHRIDTMSESASVEATTIDELARAAGLRRLDWMKLDVEGAELEVLLGASNVLQEFRPGLFIEVHGTFDPLQQFLSSAGYEIALQAFDQPPKEHGWILAHSGTSR